MSYKYSYAAHPSGTFNYVGKAYEITPKTPPNAFYTNQAALMAAREDVLIEQIQSEVATTREAESQLRTSLHQTNVLARAEQLKQDQQFQKTVGGIDDPLGAFAMSASRAGFSIAQNQMREETEDIQLRTLTSKIPRLKNKILESEERKALYDTQGEMFSKKRERLFSTPDEDLTPEGQDTKVSLEMIERAIPQYRQGEKTLFDIYSVTEGFEDNASTRNFIRKYNIDIDFSTPEGIEKVRKRFDDKGRALLSEKIREKNKIIGYYNDENNMLRQLRRLVKLGVDSKSVILSRAIKAEDPESFIGQIIENAGLRLFENKKEVRDIIINLRNYNRRVTYPELGETFPGQISEGERQALATTRRLADIGSIQEKINLVEASKARNIRIISGYSNQDKLYIEAVEKAIAAGIASSEEGGEADITPYYNTPGDDDPTVPSDLIIKEASDIQNGGGEDGSGVSVVDKEQLQAVGKAIFAEKQMRANKRAFGLMDQLMLDKDNPLTAEGRVPLTGFRFVDDFLSTDRYEDISLEDKGFEGDNIGYGDLYNLGGGEKVMRDLTFLDVNSLEDRAKIIGNNIYGLKYNGGTTVHSTITGKEYTVEGWGYTAGGAIGTIAVDSVALLGAAAVAPALPAVIGGRAFLFGGGKVAVKTGINSIMANPKNFVGFTTRTGTVLGASRALQGFQRDMVLGEDTTFGNTVGRFGQGFAEAGIGVGAGKIGGLLAKNTRLGRTVVGAVKEGLSRAGEAGTRALNKAGEAINKFGQTAERKLGVPEEAIDAATDAASKATADVGLPSSGIVGAGAEGMAPSSSTDLMPLPETTATNLQSMNTALEAVVDIPTKKIKGNPAIEELGKSVGKVMDSNPYASKRYISPDEAKDLGFDIANIGSQILEGRGFYTSYGKNLEQTQALIFSRNLANDYGQTRLDEAWIGGTYKGFNKLLGRIVKNKEDADKIVDATSKFVEKEFLIKHFSDADSLAFKRQKMSNDLVLKNNAYAKMAYNGLRPEGVNQHYRTIGKLVLNIEDGAKLERIKPDQDSEVGQIIVELATRVGVKQKVKVKTSEGTAYDTIQYGGEIEKEYLDVLPKEFITDLGNAFFRGDMRSIIRLANHSDAITALAADPKTNKVVQGMVRDGGLEKVKTIIPALADDKPLLKRMERDGLLNADETFRFRQLEKSNIRFRKELTNEIGQKAKTQAIKDALDVLGEALGGTTAKMPKDAASMDDAFLTLIDANPRTASIIIKHFRENLDLRPQDYDFKGLLNLVELDALLGTKKGMKRAQNFDLFEAIDPENGRGRYVALNALLKNKNVVPDDKMHQVAVGATETSIALGMDVSQQRTATGTGLAKIASVVTSSFARPKGNLVKIIKTFSDRTDIPVKDIMAYSSALKKEQLRRSLGIFDTDIGASVVGQSIIDGVGAGLLWLGDTELSEEERNNIIQGMLDVSDLYDD